MIYNEFDQRERDLEKAYALSDDRSPEALVTHRARKALVYAYFEVALYDEYAKQPLNKLQRDRLFTEAWTRGHAGGLSDVENEYIDLANLMDFMLCHADTI